jgi:subtilisin family serine protease
LNRAITVLVSTFLLALLGLGFGAGGLAAMPIRATDPPQPSAPMVDVTVVLKAQEDLTAIRGSTRASRLENVVQALQQRATASQQPVLELLARLQREGKVSRVAPLWIFNGIEVRATPAAIDQLAARADVQSVEPDRRIVPLGVSPTATSPEPNLSLVNAPALWSLGDRGQGVVVATMDSGVDVTQPDLAARWRGGTNSWYDPYGQHPTTPTDVNGHGTQTMGVIVGGDAGGSSIGMAPDASWIAVKIFNDQGTATASAIHMGFQWLLDPDGNPATADAPNVVSNSWAMSNGGCNLDFQLDLRSLRAAGILPIFAAGNSGPASGTSVSPANYPEAFAVGATDNADTAYSGSSRGPSSCDGSVYPELGAPGVDVRTSDLYGTWTTASGTSLAAPHVGGALALLLNAFPNISVERQESALESSAIDLGAPGPDDTFGFGRLDVLAAYNWLASAPDFTISGSPASVTAAPGSEASYSLTVSNVNGFADDIDLTLSGLSTAQATWTFSPALVSGGSGTSTLQVTPAASLPEGAYPLTVTATSNSVVHTASLTLVVAAPGTFTVSAAPASASAEAGSPASFTVTLTRINGFSGSVELTLEGVPPAVSSWEFSPQIVNGDTSTLTIATASNATPGSYQLSVSGTSGPLHETAPITLVITATPTFDLTVSPTYRSVARGRQASYSVSVSPLHGFHGRVSLTVTGLPGGAVGRFLPSTVGARGSSTLVVSTLRTSPKGTFSLVVRGQSGSLSRSATVTLVLT